MKYKNHGIRGSPDSYVILQDLGNKLDSFITFFTPFHFAPRGKGKTTPSPVATLYTHLPDREFGFAELTSFGSFGLAYSPPSPLYEVERGWG
jgi:hypothetical protein